MATSQPEAKPATLHIVPITENSAGGVVEVIVYIDEQENCRLWLDRSSALAASIALTDAVKQAVHSVKSPVPVRI